MSEFILQQVTNYSGWLAVAAALGGVFLVCTSVLDAVEDRRQQAQIRARVRRDLAARITDQQRRQQLAFAHRDAGSGK